MPGAAGGRLMLEEEFRQQVRQLARLYGWECYHTHRSDRSDAGWPDEVLAKPPRLIFAELKSAKGKVSAAQKEWLARLAACGQEVAVWRPADLPAIARVLGPRNLPVSLPSEWQ